jgi:hypothetical protein
MSKQQTNGVILWEGPEVVVIATGLATSSANTKTGGMVQVYILHRNLHPLEASKTGADVAICGNCPHRGTIIDGALKNRRCYVQIGKAPASIWKAYQRGRYRRVQETEIAAIFAGRKVRLGAYGDCAFMPISLVKSICSAARKWTGYTHQWVTRPDLMPYVMASCDTQTQYAAAQIAGWRTFRVAKFGDTIREQAEISCPASAEAGKRTTCASCLLCNGSTVNDRRKSIVIQDHSILKNQLIQIA